MQKLFFSTRLDWYIWLLKTAKNLLRSNMKDDSLGNIKLYWPNLKWKSFITSLFIFVEPQYASGAALSSSSRRLLIKTHGTSLRLYHLWFPLPIPLAMLRNYAKDQNALSGSTTMSQDQDNAQKPDKLLSSIVNRILIFFELKSKGDDQDNEWRILMNKVIQREKKKVNTLLHFHLWQGEWQQW